MKRKVRPYGGGGNPAHNPRIPLPRGIPITVITATVLSRTVIGIIEHYAGDARSHSRKLPHRFHGRGRSGVTRPYDKEHRVGANAQNRRVGERENRRAIEN